MALRNCSSDQLYLIVSTKETDRNTSHTVIRRFVLDPSALHGGCQESLSQFRIVLARSSGRHGPKQRRLICSQASDMFTMCSRYVHDMFTICSRYVHKFLICSQFIDMFTICSQFSDMFTICSFCWICSRYVHFEGNFQNFEFSI